MSSHHSPITQPEKETSPANSDLLSYMRTAEAIYPTKEQLLAEVRQDREIWRQAKKSVKGTIVLSLCILAIWIVNPTLSEQSVSTRYAEQLDLNLLDGSQAKLNSNSRITVKNRLRSREILLAQGEASFSVMHEFRPFTVTVGQTTVKDIGTTFNISKWDTSYIATVQEGVVEICANGVVTKVIAGESVKVDDGVAGAPHQANLDRVTAWQSGKLMFNATPLSEVIAEIQRYRSAPIILDPSASGLLLTGIYDVSKVELLLDSMSSMFSVTVKRKNDGHILITKK